MDLPKAINIEERAQEYFERREVLPPGWYQAILSGHELKENSAKTGIILYLKFNVSTGAGTITVNDHFHVTHASETCQKIGEATLAKYAQCMGLRGSLSSCNQLYGHHISLYLGIEEDEYNGVKFKKNIVLKRDIPGRVSSVNTSQPEVTQTQRNSRNQQLGF